MSILYNKGIKLKVRYKEDDFFGILQSDIDSNDKMLLLKLTQDVSEFSEGDTVILPVSGLITEL